MKAVMPQVESEKAIMVGDQISKDYSTFFTYDHSS